MVPCAERVVFSSSGSEAVQVAFRLARAFTGKQKVIRFEGHYHGWLDNALIGYRPAGTSADGVVNWPTEGMSLTAADETIVLQWNDLHEVEAALQSRGDEIAAIITEPILSNCYCLAPVADYLQDCERLRVATGWS